MIGKSVVISSEGEISFDHEHMDWFQQLWWVIMFQICVYAWRSQMYASLKAPTACMVALGFWIHLTTTHG